MNRELWRVGAAVIGLMVAADTGAAAAATATAPNKPGSDKVCVPGENGKGWVCGTRDNPPQVAPGTTPAAERSAPTPQPPPFLANPNRRYNAPPATIERPAETQALADDATPPPQDLPAAGSAPAATPTAAPVADTGKTGKGKGKDKGKAAATGAATAAAPTVTPTPAAAPPAPTPVVSASEAVPQPTSASGERAPVESLPEPAPATASPTVVAAPAESPAAAPDRPTPVEAAPSAPAAAVETPATAPARRAAPTSELPDSGYVIQLARGSSNHGFEQIRGKLKLDRQRAPEIRVGSAAAPEHVLLWSGFADSKTAQAALNKLPKGTAPGAWVRSVESLRPLLVDADAAPVRSVATVSEAAAPVSAAERRPAVPAAAPAAPAVEPPPPAAASAVPVAPASPAARVGSLSNTTVAAFAALPGNHYAVQLARAHSTAGFAPLIGTLGIPENSVYSVPVKTTGKLEYLLLWADFPSVEAARAAAARLPASAVQGALARRIGPLQEEARGAR